MRLEINNRCNLQKSLISRYQWKNRMLCWPGLLMPNKKLFTWCPVTLMPWHTRGSVAKSCYIRKHTVKKLIQSTATAHQVVHVPCSSRQFPANRYYPVLTHFHKQLVVVLIRSRAWRTSRFPSNLYPSTSLQPVAAAAQSASVAKISSWADRGFALPGIQRL